MSSNIELLDLPDDCCLTLINLLDANSRHILRFLSTKLLRLCRLSASVVHLYPRWLRQDVLQNPFVGRDYVIELVLDFPLEPHILQLLPESVTSVSAFGLRDNPPQDLSPLIRLQVTHLRLGKEHPNLRSTEHLWVLRCLPNLQSLELHRCNYLILPSDIPFSIKHLTLRHVSFYDPEPFESYLPLFGNLSLVSFQVYAEEDPWSYVGSYLPLPERWKSSVTRLSLPRLFLHRSSWSDFTSDFPNLIELETTGPEGRIDVSNPDLSRMRCANVSVPRDHSGKIPFQQWTNLQQLTLLWATPTLEFLELWVSNPPSHLRSLTLEVKLIPNEIMYMAQVLPKLEEFSYVAGYGPPRFGLFERDAFPFVVIPNLSRLSISSGKSEMLELFAPWSPNLECVVLDRCGEAYNLSMLKDHQFLTELVIIGPFQHTNSLDYFPRLRKLSWCDPGLILSNQDDHKKLAKAHNAVLQHLLTSPYLRELNIDLWNVGALSGYSRSEIRSLTLGLWAIQSLPLNQVIVCLKHLPKLQTIVVIHPADVKVSLYEKFAAAVRNKLGCSPILYLQESVGPRAVSN